MMPSVYLSPSTQEYNLYITGAGSEEYFMNLVADAMEPYLRANAIRFTRNTPEMTAASSIAQSAQGVYDLYLALHSNASGDGSSEGQQRGIIAFYYPTSANGRRAAAIFVDNLRRIYPLPALVNTRATTALGEVRKPKPPSVLLELGYHDNTADAEWLQSSIQPIAEALSLSLAEYFGLPFIRPAPPRTGTVVTEEDGLNIRDYPSLSGAVVGSAPPQAQVTVYGQTEGWYSLAYGTLVGYARSEFIRF